MPLDDGALELLAEDPNMPTTATLMAEAVLELRALNARLARLEALGTALAGGKNGKILLAMLTSRSGGRR